MFDNPVIIERVGLTSAVGANATVLAKRRMSESAHRRRLGSVLALTAVAYFMVVLDSVVVITALPRMQRDLHVSLSSLQWTINAYGIAFAAGIISAAALGDKIGRRKVFTFGLAMFTLASAACALTPNLSELIVARTAQGLGGAILLPLSLTILTTAFSTERRGVIIGIYGGLAGVAVAMGPLIGGAITQGIDWHWVFWINVPIGTVAAVFSIRLLPESYGARARLDVVGVGLVTAGVVAVVWTLSRANNAGWSSGEVIATLIAGVALLGTFVAWERRVLEPMVPLRLFAARDFAFGNLTSFLMNGATFSAVYMVTEEFQLGRLDSPVGAGVRLLPFLATPMVVSPIAGALSDRVGRRPIMLAGLTLQAVGYIWVASRGSLSTSWIEITLALLVAGIGISMALPTVPAAVLSAVESHQTGKASGVNYMATRFGTVFALAIATTVFTRYGHFGTPAAVNAGFKPALWVCSTFAVLSVGSALLMSRSSQAVPVTEPTIAA